jgi:hypothetical protein
MIDCSIGRSLVDHLFWYFHWLSCDYPTASASTTLFFYTFEIEEGSYISTVPCSDQ